MYKTQYFSLSSSRDSGCVPLRALKGRLLSDSPGRWLIPVQVTTIDINSGVQKESQVVGLPSHKCLAAVKTVPVCTRSRSLEIPSCMFPGRMTADLENWTVMVAVEKEKENEKLPFSDSPVLVRRSSALTSYWILVGTLHSPAQRSGWLVNYRNNI